MILEFMFWSWLISELLDFIENGIYSKLLFICSQILNFELHIFIFKDNLTKNVSYAISLENILIKIQEILSEKKKHN